LLEGEPEQFRSDARALWAFRVLDAATEAGINVNLNPYRGKLAGGYVAAFLLPLHDNGRGDAVDLGGGFDRDAARLAAAQAVFPALPADVRAILGGYP
jgi:hypothetical protein